ERKLFDLIRKLWLDRKKVKKQPEKKPVLRKERKGWPKGSKDEVLISLREQWEPLFKEMKTLQAQLLLIDSDSERGAAAHRILDLDDACQAIYEKRDYYIANGKLPEERR